MNSFINNFKDILKSNNGINSDNSSSLSDINITPEMIHNLASTISNSNKSDTEKKDSKIQDSVCNNESSNQNSSFNSIDFESIMKIKSIMETLNKKDDPRSNLLYSLKPYLRDSRQKKIDQYVNLLKITQISNIFKNDHHS